MFCRVFNFKKLRINSVDDLLPNQNNKIMFANTVKSDGFSVDFVFNKRTTKDTSLIANIDLKLEDFGLEEVKQAYQPMFLDPGRKSVFTAAIGLDTTNHQIRRCSTAELKAQKGIRTIETNIPSPKTSQCAAYLLYIEYILTHVGVLFTSYDYKTAKDRFYLYQGRQRAAEEMVNMLVHGGAKYNKKKRKKRNRKEKRSKKRQKQTANPKEKENQITKNRSQKWKPAKFQTEREKVPLVVFGAGMFGKDSIKLKRNRCGATGVFWRALKRREAAGDLIAVTIDEYKTSKVCNACNSDSLTGMPGLKGCSIQVCSICKTLWQRDINACKNMLSISLSIWDGRGRPFQYSRN
ncbi:hypothetical protein BCV72DRAFT_331883 [Rhizopus microsporus var. microsporus]|uniref:Cas12f1-like TNB domain-containing protein n=1 Tax=Rhizopus microsporus var. microsporus TaxID=86635 RepID=A0A1X0RIJ4_RHIZD|nr:hypothetical protein BCV72DRAFT_331883 [Rhizopus microsporus var. microsporus]